MIIAMYTIGYAIIISFASGVIILQLSLSKQKSNWPGLIVPAFAFTFAVALILVDTVAFSVRRFEAEDMYRQQINELYILAEQAETPGELERITELQETVRERLYNIRNRQTETTGATRMVILLWRIGRLFIPTVILLIIHWVCRRKYRYKRRMDIMSAHDL